MYDQADRVVVGKVVSVVSPKSDTDGRARIAISESLKGDTRRLSVKSSRKSCDHRFRKRPAAVLLFVAANGSLLRGYTGHIAEPDDTLLAALRAWSSAADSTARAVLLAEWIGGSDPHLRSQGLMYVEAEDLGVAAPKAHASESSSQRATRISLVTMGRGDHLFTRGGHAALLVEWTEAGR